MEKQISVAKLRKMTGMNRREFCDYFGIPYRSVEDWEHGKRKAADYLVRLMEYKLRMEKIIGDDAR